MGAEGRGEGGAGNDEVHGHGHGHGQGPGHGRRIQRAGLGLRFLRGWVGIWTIVE